ncbi:phage antirepressor KilAC domain-containing protein [Brevibacillus laterosporus]|uniref:phage antirepressor KilAC domain-containing protein n=1 Tax=Brevibacillus laterosporus TaxID=1465 RepID=UPI00264C3C03|nr:phage antirepressor KilAC domain-containing protein [Brevibacillus laterosporus]MDN9010021.1 BRO family protein [Brevibacillus laterosporus]MDO0940597.1 BRO family protein [Brevibacillus laterosporus]
MVNLNLFKHEIFGEVEVLILDGREWFGATSSAKSLGYSNPQKAVRDHCREEGCTIRSVPTSGGEQKMKFINEGNLYRLIAKSKLPSSQRFEYWIFDEILPSISKHGAYMTEGTLEKALTSPDFLIQLATKLKEEQEARSLAEEQLSIQKPKVQAHDRFINADNYQLIRESGKSLGIGEKKLYAFLRGIKLLNHKNEPYQMYVNEGYFVVKQRTFGNSSLFNVPITYVTAKGLDYIDKLLERNGGARRINGMPLAQIEYYFGKGSVDIS